HTALSNGRLLSTRENRDSTRTFHWSQALPHSNYLIALFVGEYTAAPLRSAFGTIPLTAWVYAGQEDQARFVFERTPDMVEFFSNKFRFRYPWEKYDQVAAYDYAIGAMENTSITGHNDRILRNPGQTDEFAPSFDSYNSNWTAESLIAHELAHHWFGNNTTCRSLANIWINESFASYLMMLWDEHRLGSEYLQSQTWRALRSYLQYVTDSHIIRPLEYRYFDSRDEIYNEETTYLKGALVLHMLRWILGDDHFFAALGSFQNHYQLSNVESTDLLRSIEEATGQNVQFFFEQWIWGGGHPVLDVTYSYLPRRRRIEVTVEQVQPMVEGQGLFDLPVEIRLDVKGKTRREIVWVGNQTDRFFFDSDDAPDMVSVDGRGWLVVDLRFKKRLSELVYQVKNDDLSGRLWALNQIVAQFASDPAATAAVRWVLESDAHWSLRAEAALQLRSIHSSEAEDLLLAQLSSNDYHVRKAAVIALGSRYTDKARAALRKVLETDSVDDVAAAALVALAKIDGSLSLEFFKNQLQITSWYNTRENAVLKAIEVLASDHQVPSATRFVPLARSYTSLQHHYALRLQALNTWAACAPTDPQLLERLILSARTDILPVRTAALELLGKLRDEQALTSLQEVAFKNGDPDIRKAARDTIEKIRRALNPR
ncbi:MAG: HEAT repeat domain-containing protein, partial [Ignavibacteriales bacterium]|nr:HEAT repeat domain-containing protein [Ignavibacteriales bacterium]